VAPNLRRRGENLLELLFEVTATFERVKRDYYDLLGVSRSGNRSRAEAGLSAGSPSNIHPDKNPETKTPEEGSRRSQRPTRFSLCEMRSPIRSASGTRALELEPGPAQFLTGFPGFEDILSDLFGFGEIFVQNRQTGRTPPRARTSDTISRLH